MQSFDVISIDDEAPLWSILLHVMLQDQGLAGMQAGIAEVRINNEERGLCALYGGTDATMLARWSRGNGPVLYFDPDLLWNARAAMAERTFPSNTQPQGDWLSAPLLLQGATNERNTNRARKAIQRMEAFRAGSLKASQVFDANDLAKTMALCDLLGSELSAQPGDAQPCAELTQQFVGRREQRSDLFGHDVNILALTVQKRWNIDSMISVAIPDEMCSSAIIVAFFAL